MNRQTYPRWTHTDLTQPTTTIAQQLLGSYLLHRTPQGLIILRITETEAYGGSYQGHADDASHAYQRRTTRNEPMYDAAGIAYVYLIYGIHHCLNLVTEQAETPAAVLIRGGEIVYGLHLAQKNRHTKHTKNLSNGPGKLTQAIGITRQQNTHSFIRGNLCLRHGNRHPNETIQTTTRIGIDYATHGKYFPWRFILK